MNPLPTRLEDHLTAKLMDCFTDKLQNHLTT